MPGMIYTGHCPYPNGIHGYIHGLGQLENFIKLLFVVIGFSISYYNK